MATTAQIEDVKCNGSPRLSRILHRHIRLGDFPSVRTVMLLGTDSDPYEFLWEKNSVGWTAMHFCASFKPPHVHWWRWILRLAITKQGKQEVLDAHDVMTPVLKTSSNHSSPSQELLWTVLDQTQTVLQEHYGSHEQETQHTADGNCGTYDAPSASSQNHSDESLTLSSKSLMLTRTNDLKYSTVDLSSYAVYTHCRGIHHKFIGKLTN